MRIFLAIAVVLGWMQTAEACPTSSISYFTQNNASANDTRASYHPASGTYKINLKGYLSVPSGTGPFPIIIFHHGSELSPGAKCWMDDFVARGYAVFVPHRRGHGESTGTPLQDYVQNICTLPTSERCGMQYLHMQEFEVQQAINFVKNYAPANVDPARVFMMGHSYGGLVSLFANVTNMGQAAVVSVAGGSQSWDPQQTACPTNGTAGTAECELIKATKSASKPIYFLEPANDVSIQPTIVGAKEGGSANREIQSAIFPVVCNGTCDAPLIGDDWTFTWRNWVHATFMPDTAVYAASVDEFFKRQTGAATNDPCVANAEVKSYDKPIAINPFSDDTRCDFGAGLCTNIDLKGYLYKPAASFTGTRPLVVFHHGGDDPGNQCKIAEWFTAKGYVVFVPHRRGAGISTGERVSWYRANLTPDEFRAYFHDDHADDVASSVAWARALTRNDGSAWVDQTRVSVIGHSSGGQIAMFANENDLALRAVVAISPGAASWSEAYTQTDLGYAMENAIRPVYVLQPINDISIQPTIVLAEKAGLSFNVYQSAIFPIVGSTPSEGHNQFPSGRVSKWGPTAIEFIERNAP